MARNLMTKGHVRILPWDRFGNAVVLINWKKIRRIREKHENATANLTLAGGVVGDEDQWRDESHDDAACRETIEELLDISPQQIDVVSQFADAKAEMVRGVWQVRMHLSVTEPRFTSKFHEARLYTFEVPRLDRSVFPILRQFGSSDGEKVLILPRHTIQNGPVPMQEEKVHPLLSQHQELLRLLDAKLPHLQAA